MSDSETVQNVSQVALGEHIDFTVGQPAVAPAQAEPSVKETVKSSLLGAVAYLQGEIAKLPTGNPSDAICGGRSTMNFCVNTLNVAIKDLGA